MASKRPGELAVVKTTVNSTNYIDILDHFLIPSIDNAFEEKDVAFQDDNDSCHRAKSVRISLLIGKLPPWIGLLIAPF